MKRGWDAHVLGKAPFKFTDPVEAIKSLRVRGLVCHSSWWAAQLTGLTVCSMGVGPVLRAEHSSTTYWIASVGCGSCMEQS